MQMQIFLTLLGMFALLCVVAYHDYHKFKEEQFNGYSWRLFWMAPGAFAMNAVGELLHVSGWKLIVCGIIYLLLLAHMPWIIAALVSWQKREGK
jgi:hypothetical protein